MIKLSKDLKKNMNIWREEKFKYRNANSETESTEDVRDKRDAYTNKE